MLWQKRFWTIGNKSRFTCFYKSWIRQNAPPRIPLRVKIRGTKEYAGVVELVDSVDLGDVTLGKVFRFRCSRKTEYAGMMKLVNIQDLGDVPLGKVFPVPLDFLRVIL